MPQTRHPIETVDTQDETVQLVQLTDTHLCRLRGGTLLGMDTDHSLQAVINLVQKERPVIDLLLAREVQILPTAMCFLRFEHHPSSIGVGIDR